MALGRYKTVKSEIRNQFGLITNNNLGIPVVRKHSLTCGSFQATIAVQARTGNSRNLDWNSLTNETF